MTASALAPPGEGREPPPVTGSSRAQDKANRRRLFRHVVMGYLVGIAIGVVGYVLILLSVGPDRVTVPLIYTLLALYQAGMIGGFVGVAVFMRRKSKEREGDDDEDEPGGGTRRRVDAPVAQEVAVKGKTRRRVRRPVVCPGRGWVPAG